MSPVTAFGVIFSCLVALSQGIPAHEAQAVRRSIGECLGKDGSICKGAFESCPEGWKSTLSGCGFMSKCCYQKTTSPASPTIAPHTCGYVNVSDGSKIVGGYKSSIEANPWQVSIQDYNGHFCGGSIISDRWIVTAAHCLEDIYYADEIAVVAGVSNRKKYSNSQMHYVDKFMIHGTYYPDGDGYDIGLIKLSKPLDLTKPTTRSICLPQPGQKFDEEVCVTSGWGDTKEDGHMSASIRRVAMPVHKGSVCEYWVGGLHSTEICAGYTAGGKDTCQGDSGGPLACKQADGSWVLAGVVSWGNGCAREDELGLYAEVSDFISWINRKMDQYGRT